MNPYWFLYSAIFVVVQNKYANATIVLCPINDYIFIIPFSGDRCEQNSRVSKIRIYADVGAVPGLRTRDIRVGHVLGLRHRAADHQPASPGGHVQDGTNHGPRCCGRSEAESAWR